MEIRANITEFLEETGDEISVTVCEDETDTSPYEVSISMSSWCTEKEINQIITVLQKAKKVRKTKQLN